LEREDEGKGGESKTVGLAQYRLTSAGNKLMP
jgi:hypothetical protein